MTNVGSAPTSPVFSGPDPALCSQTNARVAHCRSQIDQLGTVEGCDGAPLSSSGSVSACVGRRWVLYRGVPNHRLAEQRGPSRGTRGSADDLAETSTMHEQMNDASHQAANKDLMKGVCVCLVRCVAYWANVCRLRRCNVCSDEPIEKEAAVADEFAVSTRVRHRKASSQPGRSVVSGVVTHSIRRRSAGSPCHRKVQRSLR